MRKDINASCKALFISDDIDMCKLTELILERHRSDEVRCVSSYNEIYNAVEEKFDLIIVEFTLYIKANGHLDDGIDVYKRLRQIPAFQQIPVLLSRVPSPRQIYPIAKKLGIAGCIELVSTTKELITARDALVKGDTYYPQLQ
ncbi:MAG: hypothetical protein AAF485_29060 [Chloroflexota bacterium]